MTPIIDSIVQAGGLEGTTDNTAIIIGACVGGAVVLIAVVVGVVLYLKKSKRF